VGSLTPDQDQQFMRRALELAEKAALENEVPVGAIVVIDNEIVGEGSNRPIGSCDPSAHAEVMAIRNAAENVRNYRLPGATLYVTIEPCTMCVGAMVHARIDRIVFGAKEPKAGAVVSQNNLLEHSAMNTEISYSEGVLAEECSLVMSNFFARRRREKKALKEASKRSST
jgi:tRNA(adenine34) deaminase